MSEKPNCYYGEIDIEWKNLQKIDENTLFVGVVRANDEIHDFIGGFLVENYEVTVGTGKEQLTLEHLKEAYDVLRRLGYEDTSDNSK